MVLSSVLVSVLMSGNGFSVTNDYENIELMIPKSNPALEIKESVNNVNVNHIPNISAIDAKVIVDNDGNILAMTSIDPFEAKRQIDNGTFRQKAAAHAKEHWWKWVLGTSITATTVYIGEKNNWGRGSDKKPEEKPVIPNNASGRDTLSTSRDNTAFNITGDGNTVTVIQNQITPPMSNPPE